MANVGFVTLKSLADEWGIDKTVAIRWCKSRGIQMMKARMPGSKGQLALVLMPEEAERARTTRLQEGFLPSDADSESSMGVKGVFYIVRLVPEMKFPIRLKLGFASGLDNRIKSFRTTNPTLQIVRSWPCKFEWEKAAIASITRVESHGAGEEVFDVVDLDSTVRRAEEFFAVMPSVG